MTGLQPSIAHLTLQPVENDARVARARAALEKAGYACPLVGPGLGFDLHAMTTAHKARLALFYGSAGRLGEAAARAAFFSLRAHREALGALLAMRPDAIHAHDWDAAIVAEAASRRLRIPFLYDAHEYAADMHAERRGWRATVAPLIGALEGPVARRASGVIAVSDTIGRALATKLELREVPATVRNLPDIAPAFIAHPVAAGPDGEVRLHYHGVLARGRGIEVALAALEALPKRFVLRLTGPWRQPGFERVVRQRIAARNLASRVEIVGALPANRLVSHAAEADIGLCLLSGATLHDRGALPNKVFEYLHAGLAIVASGSDEVERIVAGAGSGAMVRPEDPGALAARLLGWDAAAIASMRGAALVAARDLTWGREKGALLEVWRSILPSDHRALVHAGGG